ncbi:U2 snRNP-associated SURP domain-containing protein [Haplosporangium bisporale]|nr:U2 snRNP-associated SURP domain-containing protein [Haplosporangium bisporale]
MPSTMQTIADSKVTGFTIGAQKRSNPFQKHKEEAELKRRKESEEAARAYEEFVASFDVDPVKSEKKFIKGKSTMMPTSVFGQEDDEDEATKELEAKAKAAYKPQMFVQAQVSSGSSSSATTPLKSKRPPLEPEATPYDRDAKAKRRRNMDAFLEELKREQGERTESTSNHSSRPLKEEKLGSRDTGDPLTTNLYIGNINPTVNEEQLCMEFAKYGPIASIKIMWPRTQEEIDRHRNCGFVSFMERADAAVALKEMDGMELLGYAMKLGWGKAVALPAVAFFVHKDYKAPPKPIKVAVRKTFHPSSTDVTVRKPTDPQLLVYIHRVIEKVLLVGHEFEQALIAKEAHNPSFSFLTDFKSPEHIYYRWKLFSLSQGDTTTRWRTEPFKMVDGGPVWVPPMMPFTDEVFEEDEKLLDAHEDEFEKAPIKGKLSRGARGFFEAQLRLLEVQLPIVFEALNEIYRSFDARLKAEQFRRQIANVLAVWENWIVFPQTYIDNLATVLTRKDVNAAADSTSPSAVSGGSSSSLQPVTKGLSSFAPVDATSTHAEDEDLDGMPMEDEDLDGVPMDDGDDLDGVPMNEDEDLDGVPMDDDLDGVPM